MLQAGRSRNAGGYRFGYQGQEADNKIGGLGQHTTAQFWEYDTWAVKRWNTDPKPNPAWSEYAVFGGNPISLADILGDTTNYYTLNGKYLGTLPGNGLLNDRVIAEDTYNQVLNEKYAFRNMTIGSYNFYPFDELKEHPEQFIWDVSEMETYLNNPNYCSEVIDLNSDVGLLSRIGYAEFRGQNTLEQRIALDITLNRVTKDKTLNDVIIAPKQYSSLNENEKDNNGKFYRNPYTQARSNKANMNAWVNSVSSALNVLYGDGRGISKGATLYYSPKSMNPPYSKPKWDFTILDNIVIKGVSSKELKIYKVNKNKKK